MKTYISHVTTSLMTILLSLFLSIGLALAQEAKPTSTPPGASKLTVPEELKEAMKLRNSLTAEQRARIQKIVQKYESQLQQVTSALSAPASRQSFNSGQTSPRPSKEQLWSEQSTLASQAAIDAAQIKSVTSQVLALQKQIDAKVNNVLDSSQKAIYSKATTAAQQKLQKAADQTADFTSQAVQSSAIRAGNYSYCGNAAYWGALAVYYSYWARFYAQLDYYFYGGSYAYSDYYYAVTYALPLNQNGLQQAGGAYFDSLYGYDYNAPSWGLSAYHNLYYARSYQYLQYYYAYLSYINNKSTYGYYAYIYGASYAYPYQGYATNNAYYCN